jgi:hypothetical protein
MTQYEPRVIKIKKTLYPDLELSRDDWKYGDIPDKYGDTDIRYNKIFKCKLQSSYKCDLCNKEYNNSISYYNNEINQHRCLNCLTDNATYDNYDVFFVTDSIDQSVVPLINKKFKENMTRITNEESTLLKCSKCNLEKTSKFFFLTNQGNGSIYCFMCYLHMQSSDFSKSKVTTNPLKKSSGTSRKSARGSAKKSKRRSRNSTGLSRKSDRGSEKSPKKSPKRVKF